MGTLAEFIGSLKVLFNDLSPTKTADASAEDMANAIADFTGGESVSLGYITNGTFEQNTNGWTGGTNLSIARTTTSGKVLAGTGSGEFTKNAVACLDDYVYTPVTIDLKDVNQILSLTFDYQAGVGYDGLALGVVLHDMTNDVDIEGTLKILPSGSGKFLSKFVLSDSLSYQLRFTVLTSSTVGMNYVVDDVSFSSEEKVYGGIVSEWQDYTPTIKATTTDPTPGTHTKKARWRRVGSNMEIEFTLNQTGAGSAGSGTYLIGLPTGYNVDSSVILTNDTSLNGTVVGHGDIEIVAATTWRGAIEIRCPSLTQLNVWHISRDSSGSVAHGHWNSGSYAFNNTTLNVSFRVSVPIAGWTSGMNLLEDFQEFAFNTQATINTNDTTNFGYGPSGTPILANTAATYYDAQFAKNIQPTDTVEIEVRSKVTGLWQSSKNAIIPSLFCGLSHFIGAGTGSSSDMYNSGIGLTQISSNKVRIYFFGSLYAASSYASPSTGALRYWSNVIAASDGFDRWRIRKVSNGNMAEIPPVIFAHAYRTTSYAASANVAIPFEGITEDATNTITLATGRFTAPIAGVYLINGFGTKATAGNTLSLYKNNASYIGLMSFAVAGGITSYSTTLRLQKGDYIDLRVDGAITITSLRFIITRIGS